MAVSIKKLFELEPAPLTPVGLFEDDDWLAANTMLQREFFARQEVGKGGVFQWDRRDYLRALAPATGRSAASKTVLGAEKDIKQIGAATFRINHTLTGEQLHAFRAVGEGAENGAAVIEELRRSLRIRMLLSIEKLCAMTLKGTVTINSTVFPDSTVEGVSIAYSPTTLAVSANWSTVGTKIISSDCHTMRAAIMDASGARIDTLLFSEAIEKMLDANTEVHSLVSALPRSIDILTHSVSRLQGAGGIRRWMSYTGSYKPEGGSVTRFIADNDLIAIPEGYQDLLVLGQAECDIPKEGGAVLARFGNIATRPGPTPDTATGYSEYVVQRNDPAGVKLIAQWSGMPLMRLPEAFGLEDDVTS